VEEDVDAVEELDIIKKESVLRWKKKVRIKQYPSLERHDKRGE